MDKIGGTMENIGSHHIWFGLIVVILGIGLSGIHKEIQKTNREMRKLIDELFDLKLVLNDILGETSSVETQISLLRDDMKPSKSFDDHF
jgi:hypothetical protein